MTDKESSLHIINQVIDQLPKPHDTNTWYDIVLDNGFKMQAMTNSKGYLQLRKESKLYLRHPDGSREFCRLDWTYFRVNKKGIIVAV